MTDTDVLGVATANLLLSSLNNYRTVLVGPGLGDADSFMSAFLDGLKGRKTPCRRWWLMPTA